MKSTEISGEALALRALLRLEIRDEHSFVALRLIFPRMNCSNVMSMKDEVFE